jgi:hypothetical protein
MWTWSYFVASTVIRPQRNWASAWENRIFGSLTQKSGSFTATCETGTAAAWAASVAVNAAVICAWRALRLLPQPSNRKNGGLELAQASWPENEANEEKESYRTCQILAKQNKKEEQICNEKTKLWLERRYNNNTTSTTAGTQRQQGTKILWPYWNVYSNQPGATLTCWCSCGWAASRHLQTSGSPVVGANKSHQ